MSDVFEGFNDPTENWSRLPHSLIENLYRITSGSELKVILYILRHTWGFHDDQKKITIDEFCHGRKRRDGTRLDQGTGLSENAIKAGIEKATEHGFIEVSEDATDKARIKRYYHLRGSKLEGQKLTPWPSKVDPLPSKVDPRSEKETNGKIQKKETASPFKNDSSEQQGPLTTQFISLCKINTNTMTERQKGNLMDALKILVRNNITADRLLKFGEFWISNWRGQNGQPPSPLQVPELWGEFEEWDKTTYRPKPKYILVDKRTGKEQEL